MKLNNKLKNLNSYPFHMPGHKRNARFGIAGSEIDITEIDGFDNLHNAGGILLDIENRLSEHYKSKKSFMLVNGSTVGILSAVFAVCKEGDKIIVARNCHKSVYNACMLRHLSVVYIEPAFDFENGYYTHISQADADKAIKDNADAKAMIITSPTYEGNVCHIDITIPLIVDAAHGAHLGLAHFPPYPKGDIVISSLHKTLPALTQTAVINICNAKYINRVKLYLDIFETSSPSYVLMNSVDICLDYLKNKSDDFFKYYNNLQNIHSIKLKRLKIKKNDDKSKIVVSSAKTNLSGNRLSKILRNDFNIEVEAAGMNYVILMTSVADTKEAFLRLKDALLTIDDNCCNSETFDNLPFRKPLCPKGEQIISMDDASVESDLREAIGKTANEFIFSYPPDIPIVFPNEIISEEIVEYVTMLIKSGVNIVSDSGLLPNKILTKKDI